MPVKILFLNPCAQLGGAERCLLDVLASLRAAKPAWQLHLIAAEDGPLLAAARDLGVFPECLPFPRRLARLGSFQTRPRLFLSGVRAAPALLLYRARLRKAVRRVGPSVIHSNGLKMHLLAAWNERRAPVVWHLHDYLSRCGLLARALRRSASRCAGAVAVSRAIATDAHRVLGASVLVRTILNGIDLQRFHPSGPRPFLRPGRPHTVKIGLIATFARWKGHAVFLKALADPRVRELDIHAYVIGAPIYETAQSQHSAQELTAMAETLGLGGRVTFTGFLSDSAPAMRALDIVVHASTAPEPFGLVIAEAMACGRPVIASEAAGAAELLIGDTACILTPPGDVDALADAISRLTRDGIARLAMGRAARAVAETRFNRDRLGPALVAFYKEVLSACDYSTSTAAISTAA